MAASRRSAAFALAAIVLSVAAAHGATLPSPADVRAAYVSSEALLVDREGRPLSEIRVNAKVRQRDWVPLSDVSPALQAALIAGEDKRFHEHAGVDWPGLAVAAWDSAWRAVDGRRPRGGSTLTMQLAGLLDPALRPDGGEPRTLAQKWDQLEAALALESAWTKAQILEAYLNLSSFRGELRGLAAAAHGLFGKSPSGLDARESAVLVALLRAPGAKPPVVAQRACAVANAVAGGQRLRADPRARGGGARRRLPDARAHGARAAPRREGAEARRRAHRDDARRRLAGVSRSARCATTWRNSRRAAWPTARWSCSTTRAATCWPTSAAAGISRRRRRSTA